MVIIHERDESVHSNNYKNKYKKNIEKNVFCSETSKL